MSKTASLYRMVTDEHICPYGLRSKDLLERKGFSVDDHKLTSREETDRFQAKYDVKTTPQTFITETAPTQPINIEKGATANAGNSATIATPA